MNIPSLLAAAWLQAIATVEGNVQAHNHRSPHGVTKAAIADVNDRTGKRYRWSDRRTKSAEIALAYVRLWHPKNKPFDPVTAARIIRYGPRGAHMTDSEDTETYGERVRNLTFTNMGWDA